MRREIKGTNLFLFICPHYSFCMYIFMEYVDRMMNDMYVLL